MKKILLFLAMMVSIAFLYSFVNTSQGEPWVVPEKYVKLKNPVKADEGSIKTGKALYERHCQSCHGKTGRGDGTKAASLETEPGDFSTKEFKAQPDGSMFYKIQAGRDEMPAFKTKIPDEEEIWQVVNYMKTF